MKQKSLVQSLRRLVKDNFSFVVVIAATFLALAAIVAFTFGSFYRSARENAVTVGSMTVALEAQRIEDALDSGINTLLVSSYTVDTMLKGGADAEAVNEYLVQETLGIQEGLDPNFTGIYGVVNDVYVDGTGTDWVPEGYNPYSRPWYHAAAEMAKRSLLLKWKGILAAAAIFAVIGGALGSVVTWVLYGFSFGAGISAPLAKFLFNSLHMSEFASQFGADMLIDIADKLVTVLVLRLVLWLLPERLMSRLPLGCIYSGKALSGSGKIDTNDVFTEQKPFLRHSLRTKNVLLIVCSTAILSATALLISSVTYKSRLTEQYSEMCSETVGMMIPKIDGDLVDSFVALGEEADGYKVAKADLYDIKNNCDKIKFMYVFKIQPDGCHVVFDLDSGDMVGESAGAVIPFDKSFPYTDELIAGKEIPPVITDDTYGWLLTVYKPVTDKAGSVVAYAAADIDMKQIRTDLYAFCISIASLLFGVMIVITAFALWYCDRNLLEPMGVLAEQARGFDFDGNNGKSRIRDSHDIKTGDEIEEVFRAMCRTEDAIDEHIAQLKAKNIEISRMQRNIIYTLANMVENRDGNTGGHIKRTAGYVGLIGAALLKAKLYPDTVNEEYVRRLCDSAPLHDIGKIKIPDAILNKPGRLTADEFELMKTHTTEGALILRSSLSEIEDGSWLSTAIDMAEYHHERWDGTGYPRGLSGDAIPLCARIMAVSDVFDALMSRRSYKDAFSFETSMQLIIDGSGTQFDKQIVDVFVKSESEIKEILARIE